MVPRPPRLRNAARSGGGSDHSVNFCLVEPQFALECLLAQPDSRALIAMATDVNLHTWASPRMPENPRLIKGGLTPLILYIIQEVLE